MRPRAHLAVGAAIGAIAAPRMRSLSAVESAVFSALAANAPDGDLFLPSLTDADWWSLSPSSAHHNWITHTPAFWAGSLAVGSVAARIIDGADRDGRASDLARLAWLSVAAHLIQDSISDRLPLLWPLSDKRLGLRLAHTAPFDASEADSAVVASSAESRGGLIGAISEIRANARSWSGRYKRSVSARVERALIAASAVIITGSLINAMRESSRE